VCEAQALWSHSRPAGKGNIYSYLKVEALVTSTIVFDVRSHWPQLVSHGRLGIGLGTLQAMHQVCSGSCTAPLHPPTQPGHLFRGPGPLPWWGAIQPLILTQGGRRLIGQIFIWRMTWVERPWPSEGVRVTGRRWGDKLGHFVRLH
jgi:hypothetical protein